MLVDPRQFPSSRCYPFTPDWDNVSDHRPIRFATPPSAGYWMEFDAPTRRKPRNWKWNPDVEFDYNDKIRSQLGHPLGIPGVAARLRPAALRRPPPLLAIRAYSDGSFKDAEECGAGWGYTIFKPALQADILESPDNSYVLTDAFGPVELRVENQDFIGARYNSSSSAELSGLAELLWRLLWDLSAGQYDQFGVDGTINIIIYVDSLFAKDVAKGRVIVNSHPLLAALVQHLWRCLSTKMHRAPMDQVT
jgi:hypothetical protein